MRTNQCTIANKEVGVATHLTQTQNQKVFKVREVK